ncbi:hydroxyphenylacetyl-CoA thioesterase PaaI [Sulfurospirillum sp. 1612]|uniref:hydroxyphenylacetyl-CoA thioesterase PaaI n=1 Tax=Sulfurospirillum sp. 1612 TaxID=3094835 RepID=UPI002F94A787
MNEKQLAEACVKALNEKAMFENHLGAKIVAVDAGYAKLVMPVQEFMLNGHRTCQGGAIFSFADAAFAYACNGRNVPTVAFACDITFVKPAFEGDVLTAEGVEKYLSGRNGIYDIKVSNQKGETIALFVGKSRAVAGSILDEKQLKEIQ